MPGHPELRLTLPGNKLTMASNSSNSSNSNSSKSSALSAHVVAKRLEQASSIYSQVITVWSAPSTSHAIFLCSWDLEIWHRVATPNRSIRELLHLRIAPFENRSI